MKPTISAHCDFESRSTVDLKTAGAYRYAEDRGTEVLCLSYRIGDGPIERWRPGDPDPKDLLDHISSGGDIVAHNSAFERRIFTDVLPRMGYGHWPVPTVEQYNCTMVRAMALALPGSLGDLGPVLRLSDTKDKDGASLMLRMCKPRKPKKHEDQSIVYWIDDEISRKRLEEYCDKDVATETAADKKLPQLIEQERQLFFLDQRINDRGVQIDIKNARKLMAIAKIVVAAADARMAILTRGKVTACSQAAAITAFVHSRGIHCESVKKDCLDEILRSAEWCGDDILVEVIELRREFAKASTAKIKAMIQWVNKDGRARGMLQFNGAGITNRWSGRGPQPQNLPRVDADKDLPKVNQVFEILEECGNNIVLAAKRISAEVGPVLPMISKCLRGLLTSAPGKRLLGGDLSAIEGRGSAWLCGATKKIKMYYDVDAGLIPDAYKVTYAETFGVQVEDVTGEQRQIGKTEELGFGYQGSVGAFVNFASEKLLLSIVEIVKSAVSQDTWDSTWAKFAKRRDRCELTQAQWTAIKIVVDNWRRSEMNAPIVQGWWDLQDAAIEAVEHPGRPVSVFGGKVVYVFSNSFLWCRLPSKRALAYFNPAIAMSGDEVIVCEDGKVREVDLVGPDELDRLEAAGVKSYETNLKKKVEFEGYAVRNKGGGKVWVKRIPGSKGNLSLYGGRQLENITQAFCRDIMAHGMVLAEKAGLPIILTVHDELVAEVPEDRDDLNEDLLKKCMTTNPKWLPGFPLAAKCWSDKRYVK